MRPRIIPVLPMLLLLAGCVSVKVIGHGPTGQPEYLINCSGTGLSWASCYRKARKLCSHRAYKVLSKYRQPKIIFNPVCTPAGCFPLPDKVIMRKLTVMCTLEKNKLPSSQARRSTLPRQAESIRGMREHPGVP